MQATSKFRYDTNGFLLETEDALGQITRTSADATGKIVSSTNPNLETLVFGYDLDRNLNEIVLPGNLLHRLSRNISLIPIAGGCRVISTPVHVKQWETNIRASLTRTLAGS